MVWRHSSLVAEVCTESIGRVAVLHLDAAQPMVLAGPAAAIWELLDGRRDQTDVITELETAFADTAGQLAHQVEGFLANLEAQHLIEAAHQAGK